ncbi:MAG: glycerophosphodiester phosphodiesterase family protein [Bacteroidales bacterium]|jgi:glycerophosphoryl diester phosphodiesterase|nr:glycerophosphodiester phosphodiesterase family protein [Bacteroidales bacterium]
MAIKSFVVLFFLFLTSTSGNTQTSGKSEAGSTSDNRFVLLAAHRGGFDSDLPENSLALFNFTCSNTALKPVILELDIRASKSGSLYLMHDETLERTTSGRGCIAESDDDYLNSLLLRDRNSQLTNQKIPLLSQVLQEYKDKEVILMLDVKGNIHREVTEMLKITGMEAQCIMLTFKPEITKSCFTASSKMKISALVRNPEDWASVRNLSIPANQLIVYFDKNISDSLLSEIGSMGILLMTDMNESLTNHGKPFSAEIYSELIKRKKTDILITDFPAAVSQMIVSKYEKPQSIPAEVLNQPKLK